MTTDLSVCHLNPFLAMGCTATKPPDPSQISCWQWQLEQKPLMVADPHEMRAKRNDVRQTVGDVLGRVAQYEQGKEQQETQAVCPLLLQLLVGTESMHFLDNLYLTPKSLLPENLGYGYVSVNAFFNLFHAGFCAPYIANPNYLLLVDFRLNNII